MISKEELIAQATGCEMEKREKLLSVITHIEMTAKTLRSYITDDVLDVLYPENVHLKGFLDRYMSTIKEAVEVLELARHQWYVMKGCQRLIEKHYEKKGGEI